MKNSAIIKILITDDHRLFRESLRLLLQSKSGLQVVGEAENGKIAVRKAKELHPDVVLMDISMPVLGGVDATRQISCECPGTSIIALSNQTEEYYVQAMKKAGAAGFLAKSANLKQLERTIRKALSTKPGN